MSQDPHLGMMMVQPAVEGIQSQGVIANAKHFVLNSQETNRTSVSAQVDERTRFEIYYPPFEGAIKAGVGSMMCSYNRIATPSDRLGNWSCEHPETLNVDLRKRLNQTASETFWMMSDWGAAHSNSLMQGLDQEMPGALWLSTKRLNQSVFGWSKQYPPPLNRTMHFPPTATMERVNQAVMRVLEPMFRMGLFDRPTPFLNASATNVSSAAHNSVARRLARSAMVLLKNENALMPLDLRKLGSIALIGRDAAAPTVGGGGNGGSHPNYVSTPLASIRLRFAGISPPPPSPSVHCPGQVLAHTVIYGDDTTSFPATSKCTWRPKNSNPNGGPHGQPAGIGPNCGQPNISMADCCQLCQRRGDPRGMPGPCVAYSYEGQWDSGSRRVIYTCNLHGTVGGHAPATNTSCFNLSTAANKYKCAVATSGIIRPTPPAPAPECGAKGKCLYYDDGSNIASAQAVTAKANVTVVFVSTISGEGMDRSTLSLGDSTNQLVASLANATQKLIVFMVHPGSVLTPWRDSVQSLVASFMPGQEYGNAVADLLFGEDGAGAAVSPSARLPVTFPNHDNEIDFTQEQWPGTYEPNGTGSCKPKHHCLDPSDNNCLLTKDDSNCHYSNYTEELLVGYRYYAARNITPAFCFGHGLGFVDFHYSSLSVSTTVVSFDLENMGTTSTHMSAAEVAQLYIDFPPGAGEPPMQLKGFLKVHLEAGQKKRVSMPVEPRTFSTWSIASHKWEVAVGVHHVMVGSSSCDIRLRGQIIL